MSKELEAIVAEMRVRAALMRKDLGPFRSDADADAVDAWADRLSTQAVEGWRDIATAPKVVAYVAPVARVCTDGSYEDGPAQLCFAEDADAYVKRVGLPLIALPSPPSDTKGVV